MNQQQYRAICQEYRTALSEKPDGYNASAHLLWLRLANQFGTDFANHIDNAHSVDAMLRDAPFTVMHQYLASPQRLRVIGNIDTHRYHFTTRIFDTYQNSFEGLRQQS